MSTLFAQELPAEVTAWLERRRALGQDRYDEVWEGVHHVVPGPTNAHGFVDDELGALLRSLARRAGLYRVSATNLGREGDYRVPDGMVLRARPTESTYAETAAVVVEVLSPGDETFAKFPFYAAREVEEVVVADPQGRRVRLWQLRDGAYVETGRSDVLGTTAEELTAGVDWP